MIHRENLVSVAGVKQKHACESDKEAKIFNFHRKNLKIKLGY
jgi:hypothetical protein